MKEYPSYEEILSGVLSNIKEDIDKREGSLIYTAVAPVCAELAKAYMDIESLTKDLLPDEAEGDWLDRAVNQFGLQREQASNAQRKANILMEEGSEEIPPGSRFGCNGLFYRLEERLSETEYRLICETAGTAGNRDFGTLLPVEYIKGLISAALSEVLIPARDEEEDESLRSRFFQYVRETPFGGNIADYEQKTLGIEGVGAVKVFGADKLVSLYPEGGHVGLVIGNEQERAASSQLIERVRKCYGENGNGLAPIGHTVHIETAKEIPVTVDISVKIKQGEEFALIKSKLEQAAKNYINGIGFFQDTVYLVKLTASLLSASEKVLDITEITVMQKAENFILSKEFLNYQIPVVGSITVTEGGGA